jgi:hypothetical protein
LPDPPAPLGNIPRKGAKTQESLRNAIALRLAPLREVFLLVLFCRFTLTGWTAVKKELELDKKV